MTLQDHNLPIPAAEVEARTNDDLPGYISWVVTASKLLRNCPTIAYDTNAGQGIMKGAYAAEDWYRAL